MFEHPSPYYDFYKDYLKGTERKPVKGYLWGATYYVDTLFVELNRTSKSVNPAIGDVLGEPKYFPTAEGRLNAFINIIDFSNIFHILHYTVTRILTMNESLEDVDFWFEKHQYDMLMNNSSVLTYLNLAKAKDISIKSFNMDDLTDSHYLVKNAVIAHYPLEFGHCSEDFEILRKNFVGSTPILSNYKKVYARRDDEKYSRVPSNEKALSDYMENKGFTSIALEDFSIADQINICRHAEILVGFSGTGLTNTFFGDNKKLIVEFTYTPNSDEYYPSDVYPKDITEDTNPEKIWNMEIAKRRYYFDWPQLTALTGANHLKINFEKVDTCEEVIKDLENNYLFQQIIALPHLASIQGHPH